ncbi:hypothetical protein BVG16_29455 [Paenibacillus selenitireducens]|uniref:Uncharacterized protein n=1 Tax=Paenibacillus selenitireducens TaxID=1324314 RepID=A0A1T2X0B7_9BACL|nr:hypothetical protein [Paenibacillus selenitireducens]OPA73329.1 hypothetical protein BVG16_29455 [Paenibacillus selenitireducens]
MTLVNEEALFIQQDLKDLNAILEMRFGEVPAEVLDIMTNIRDLNRLQRLILVACNTPDWKVFVEELQEGEGAYRLTGERFNPLGMTSNEG